MTVCVAVLCQDGAAAIGASDRMLSTADNQTKMVKIHHLTDEVVVMISGDVALHSELLIELRSLISLNAHNPDVLTVKNLADSYTLAFYQAKVRRSERQFLLPLGLTAEKFTSQQHGLSEKLTGEIAKELLYFSMPDCSAIFMGVDSSSGYLRAHLYTVENGHMTCRNETGFAAIGVGVYQAASSLMFSGHNTSSKLDTALYLTFAAKKRAEVAPGVGVDTDMVYVSNSDPKYILLASHVMSRLDSIYATAEKTHKRANTNAERQCHEYLKSLRDAPTEQQSGEGVELAGTPPSETGGSTSSTGNERQPPKA